MRQAIHIFRKDVLHCWPYIAAVMALIAVNTWRATDEIPSTFMSVSGGSFLFLLAIVIAWWLVIGAAVHGESLVGDRQFWVTRPYSWKSLLGAKFLFFAAFLGLPVFVSDCVVLRASGFNPALLIPGLLWRQCWLAVFLTLPFVVAALTRTTRDFAFAGILFYVVSSISSVLAVGFILAHGPVQTAKPLWIWDAAPWLVYVAGMSLGMWQYARRRTTLIRVLALVLGAVLCVMVASGLYSLPEGGGAVLRQEEPEYRNIAVELDAQPGSPDIEGFARERLQIPVRFSGWPRNLMVCDLRAANLVEQGVLVWASADPQSRLNPQSDGLDWVVLTGNTLARALKNSRADRTDLVLAFDLKIYEEQGSANLPPDGGRAFIPGFGSVQWAEYSGERHLVWRTPLKSAVTEWAYELTGPHTSGEWRDTPGSHAPASPLTFPFSPVHTYGANVFEHGANPGPAVVTARHLVATIQRDLKISHIRLADYEAKQP